MITETKIDTRQHYVVMRHGVLSFAWAKPGEPAPNVWKASEGGKHEAESVGGPFPMVEGAWEFAKNYEPGWYAALYQCWGSGPYAGDQDIDWRVLYGTRPEASSNFDFACGPWETEEQAKDAAKRFAEGLPFTWTPDEDGVEVDREEYDPHTGEYGKEYTETIYYSGMTYDVGILDTYPVRPPADMSHLPALSTK